MVLAGANARGSLMRAARMGSRPSTPAGLRRSHRGVSRVRTNADAGSEGTNTQASGLYFVDKFVEDPINALLVLGPRALAGAIDSLPKTVDEAQAETEQVRDKLTMLAQDPRPWDVKSELMVREADRQLEELVQKGSKAFDGDAPSSFVSTSAASPSTGSGLSTANTEEEERSYQELSRKVAEFTNLYLLLREVKKAERDCANAGEADEKMYSGILKDTQSSLAHRLDELSEGLEEDLDLPFKDLVEEAREACAASK